MVFKNGEIVEFMYTIKVSPMRFHGGQQERRDRWSEMKGIFTQCTADSRSCTFTWLHFALSIPWDNPEENPVECCFHSGFKSWQTLSKESPPLFNVVISKLAQPLPWRKTIFIKKPALCPGGRLSIFEFLFFLYKLPCKRRHSEMWDPPGELASNSVLDR